MMINSKLTSGTSPAYQTQVCPACGGLECMCRPRFFAGQLLTDETLNQLDRYIVGKNRLHNRYLFGAGVVCGMDVVCHPCGDQVIVKSGYAISPCGDDLIVCGDDVVPVCDLIRECRTGTREDDCDPRRLYASAVDCQDVDQDWVLAICYEEKLSRGVMALKATTNQCSRCGGTSSSCGCSGSSKNNGTRTTRNTTATRSTPAQCEPSVTCEGYRYVVYKAPSQPTLRVPGVERGSGLAAYSKSPALGQLQPAGGYGKIVQRFLACLRSLTAVIPTPPTEQATPDQLYAWCCRLKEGLVELFSGEGIYDCNLITRLQQFECIVPQQGQAPDDYAQQVETALAPLYEEYIRHCLCAAIIPPCPEPAGDNCVPLATITVSGGATCTVKRICVWDSREQLVTIPALEYWLSTLPIAQLIRQALDQACCAPVLRRVGGVRLAGAGQAPREAMLFRRAAGEQPGAAAQVKREQAPGELFDALLKQDRPVNTRTLAQAMLGFVDPQGQPLVSEIALDNPLQFLFTSEFLTPLVQSFVPPTPGGTPGAAAGQKESGPAPEAEVAGLRQQVQDLQKALRDQEARLNTLADQLKRKR